MPEDIKIRKATRNDASAIHELHTKSVWQLCKNHYSDAQLHGWLDHRIPERYYPAIDQGRFFVATEGSVVVGFGAAEPGEVWAIYVSPDRINEGIGSILLKQAMRISQSDSSKVVLTATLNSVDFYRRHGFVAVEETTVTRGNIELPCILMEYVPID